MRFDTKIAVVVRDDLLSWQALNVTAFTISGIAGTQDVIGLPYVDANGVEYLPMIKQPVMVFQGTGEQLSRVADKARSRGLAFSVYTEELFVTGHDDANRAAVRAVSTATLNLVGLALYGSKNGMDKVLKGLSLHQ